MIRSGSLRFDDHCQVTTNLATGAAGARLISIVGNSGKLLLWHDKATDDVVYYRLGADLAALPAEATGFVPPGLALVVDISDSIQVYLRCASDVPTVYSGEVA